MSHIATLEAAVNSQHFKAFLTNKGIKTWEGTVKFFSGQAAGLCFKLPDWRYPIVVTADGNLVFDNYDGYWGDINALYSLVQDFLVDEVKKVAQNDGLFLSNEEKLDNGDYLLTFEV